MRGLCPPKTLAPIIAVTLSAAGLRPARGYNLQQPRGKQADVPERERELIVADMVQPQGYTSADVARPPLPDDSPKLQQWEDLKRQIGREVRVKTFVGHTDAPQHSEVTARLVDVLLMPTSPPVYRWLHDEMWTIRLRVERPDGEQSELVVDQTTEIAFMG